VSGQIRAPAVSPPAIEPTTEGLVDPGVFLDIAEMKDIFTTSHFVLATSPLRLTASYFIFQLNTCGYGPYLTSPLMTRWVSRLQLLLGLASAIILTSESHEIHDHTFYCLRFETPQSLGPGPRICIPQVHGGPVLPQALGSLFVAFYRVGVRVTLRLTVIFVSESHGARDHILLSQIRDFCFRPSPTTHRSTLYSLGLTV
jgi:hypothetical protein